MSKNALAIFFAVIFSSLITAPTIFIVMDNDIDMAILFDISEEEEEKGNQKHIEFEVIVEETPSEISEFANQSAKVQLITVTKTYLQPHPNLFSPPPECHS